MCTTQWKFRDRDIMIRHRKEGIVTCSVSFIFGVYYKTKIRNRNPMVQDLGFEIHLFLHLMCIAGYKRTMRARS